MAKQTKQLKHKNSTIVIAACRFELSSTAPDEIQLTPAGRFSAKDGRPHNVDGWLMNAANAQIVINYAKSLTDDFVIDYEHQTLHAEKNGQPAPAGGWFKDLEWREGEGLFAKVQWTDAAKAAIESGEYRYISPVIASNKKTGDVTAVLMAALVNYAAVDGMRDLTSLAANFFDTPNLITEDLPVDKETLLLLGLAVDASPEEINKAILALIDKAKLAEEGMVALKAQSMPLDTVNQTVNALKEQVTGLQTQLNTTEASGLINDALSDGRLLPAQKKWAEDTSKENLDSLKSFLATSQPIDALKGTQTEGKTPPDLKEKTALSDTDIAACKALGISQDDYKITLAEQDK